MPRKKQLQKSGLKRQGEKGELVEKTRKRSKEPVDYGVTKGQLYEILDKASQPTKKKGNSNGTEQSE